MTKIKVIEKYKNIKISEYIKTLNENLTISSIKRSINKGDVKVNGIRVKDNYLLNTNDELTIYINIKKQNDKFLKTSIKVPIFYEDENIIIFNKPKGISCQENENEKINTLNNYIKKYCFNKNYWDGYDNESEPCLVHRIDQNTSGLVLGAKNKEIARILNKAINDEISKKYLTIIYNKPKHRKQKLVDYISRDEKQKNKMIVSNKKTEFSSEIKTNYEVVSSNDFFSILEVELLTGKKHQIRAHLAYHHMYIVGDSKYGIKNKHLELKGQILISNSIKFNLTDEKLAYLNNKVFVLYKDPAKLYRMVK